MKDNYYIHYAEHELHCLKMIFIYSMNKFKASV